MTFSLVVPDPIEAVIQSFRTRADPFTQLDVANALGAARQSMKNPSEGENFGAWAEVLAFALAPSRRQPSPWGTYFGPMGTAETEDGKIVYFPDIAGTDAHVLDHWTSRAETVTQPVLKARYADLVWDVGPVIAKGRRDPDMARLAIDAYLASVSATIVADLQGRLEAAERALDLALFLRDAGRIDSAKTALLSLHREVIASGNGSWWRAFDRLIEDKRSGVTDAEREELVTSLEGLVERFGDTGDPQAFNPHALQDAAKRLIRYHTKGKRRDDVKRLNLAIARAFEHFAGMGDAMVASAILQTAINAYRDAGMAPDSKRLRILMEEKIGQARDQMKPHMTEIKISREDMESFVAAVVVDDVPSTFIHIVNNFLPSKRHLEEMVQKTVKHAPLTAHITRTVMAEAHIAAKVRSVKDDPYGRLIVQAKMNVGIEDIWLQTALQKAIEKHDLMPEHFVAWANRLHIFDDTTFLMEGVRAWYDGDLVKAVYVLIPQVECGLRGIVAKLGQPVTKAHPTVPGVGVAMTMGDILNAEVLREALGPDLTLHFLAIYSDPRGLNLRNNVAHGLVRSGAISESLVRLLVLTLLIFGVWQELAAGRR